VLGIDAGSEQSTTPRTNTERVSQPQRRSIAYRPAPNGPIADPWPALGRDIYCMLSRKSKIVCVFIAPPLFSAGGGGGGGNKPRCGRTALWEFAVAGCTADKCCSPPGGWWLRSRIPVWLASPFPYQPPHEYLARAAHRTKRIA
jgi:hypothetical protein